MRKRLLSVALCICMMLTLLPGAALADGGTAAAATSVTVGGVELDGTDGKTYATTDSDTGVVTPVEDSAIPTDNYVKFENGVLTLKNATIAGATKIYGSNSSESNVGIYAEGALELVLEDENSIVFEKNSSTKSCGIDTCSSGGANNADLTIGGTGSLEITAPTTTAGNSEGISASGILTIESGSITATGGDTSGNSGNSYGVLAVTDFVMTGGTLTATGCSGARSASIRARSLSNRFLHKTRA